MSEKGLQTIAMFGLPRASAVPKLIEHLDDERLTRGMMQDLIISHLSILQHVE